MTPTHREIVGDVGDGWAVVWESTDVPEDVRSAFQAARDEQRAENAALVESSQEDQVADAGEDS